jgi:hypothetical protein
MADAGSSSTSGIGVPPAGGAASLSSAAAEHRKRNRIRFSCTICREKK